MFPSKFDLYTLGTKGPFKKNLETMVCLCHREIGHMISRTPCVCDMQPGLELGASGL